MEDFEPFTLVSEKERPQLFGEFKHLTSNKTADLDVQFVSALRAEYPDLIVTTIPASNIPLLTFAQAGYAIAKLDESEPVIRWRGFNGPQHRGGEGFLAESRFFAKYHYKWFEEDFIMYSVVVGYSTLQYVLKEPRHNETTSSISAVTDALITAVGKWIHTEVPAVYTFDNGYWSRSTALYDQVMKSTWDKVILDPKMKKDLAEVTGKFFDSKEIYEEYGVPWKRGLIFHGPVGNGKTISIKALMHGLYDRKSPIPSLYVKSAPQTYNIRSVFAFARTMSPCMLILEDIDTIVTPNTRSYFFNEVDGIESNDGILMVATTNYLERLDPGLSKRPSRFDRKYLFPLPNLEERTTYCEFWRNKLKNKPSIHFPKKLCGAIAGITDQFSFAYLQEAFVATLLVLARRNTEGGGSDDDDDDDELDKYELWRVMKQQVKNLREDMGSSKGKNSGLIEGMTKAAVDSAQEELVPLLASRHLDGPRRAPELHNVQVHDIRDDGGLNAQYVGPGIFQAPFKYSRVNDASFEWGP